MNSDMNSDMNGMDLSGGYLTNMDTLVAPLEEVELWSVMNLLGSTLREATDKLKILDNLDEDQKEMIPQAALRLQWKAQDQLAASEVPEVALLLKIVIAQQVAYEALAQRTEKVRQRQKYDQQLQQYCEEGCLAVQTLDRVKAALHGAVKKGTTDSFWQSIGVVEACGAR
jgi:hypothetical protein